MLNLIKAGAGIITKKSIVIAAGVALTTGGVGVVAYEYSQNNTSEEVIVASVDETEIQEEITEVEEVFEVEEEIIMDEVEEVLEVEEEIEEVEEVEEEVSTSSSTEKDTSSSSSSSSSSSNSTSSSDTNTSSTSGSSPVNGEYTDTIVIEESTVDWFEAAEAAAAAAWEAQQDEIAAWEAEQAAALGGTVSESYVSDSYTEYSFGTSYYDDEEVAAVYESETYTKDSDGVITDSEGNEVSMDEFTATKVE